MTRTATPPGAVERLRAKMALIAPQAQDASRQMWAEPDLAGTYRSWLMILHGTIRATVPLMNLALERCLQLRPDPVAERLAQYFAKHIHEEYGHDEWVAEDLLLAGADPADLDGFLPGPEIAALVGSQYYWIKHVHPVALIGHIAVLEGSPPAPELASSLARRSGLPEAAFRTVERHSALDVRHAAEVTRLIDALPLAGAQERLLHISALHTIRGLIEVIDSRPRPASAAAGAVGPVAAAMGDVA